MPERFVSFVADGRECYGVVVGDGIKDLTDRVPGWPTLHTAIAADGLDRLREIADTIQITHAMDGVRFRMPVTCPDKIICVGINYPDRDAEYSDIPERKGYPSLFVRFPCSLTGHLEPLCMPRESSLFDYEGEIVLVIGTGGRRIPAASALDHVAGLSLCNEGTLRDWVRHARFNVTQGKNFDRTGSMGPWMVRYTHQSQIDDIRLVTRVNGEIRQDDRTSRMTYSPSYLIAYISSFTTLLPGDVIITGTPAGAGARLDPPVYLVPGDVVEIEAEGLGRLRNVVSEPS